MSQRPEATSTNSFCRAGIASAALMIAIATGCSVTQLQGQPDCTGVPVPAIACLVGPTVQTCSIDSNGRPVWVTTCPGESDGGSDGGGIGDPAPLTFSLQNGGLTSVYLFEGCVLDLTITALIDPPQAIGLPDGGCGVCDCAAQSCPQVVCGPCYFGGLEVAPGAAQPFSWTPVDVTYEARATSSCSRSRVLPAGRYRIDVPVYASPEDANAKTGARIASQTFDLPASDLVVQLGASP